MLWSGEFVSFHTAIQPAWLSVIEGPRYVRGQNLEAKRAFNAFAVPDSHIAQFVDR